jgi:hypothetical protein
MFTRIEVVEVLARVQDKDVEEYAHEKYCERCRRFPCALNPICKDGYICPYFDLMTCIYGG